MESNEQRRAWTDVEERMAKVLAVVAPALATQTGWRVNALRHWLWAFPHPHP